jgi:NADH-quinone oxidoreductase subunit L
MDRYGGLRGPMRYAYLTLGIGCLAIAGVPGFSGFFSKDAILSASLEAGKLGPVCWVIGMIGAGLTAFYMFRLLFRTFWNTESPEGWPTRPHLPGWVMNVPVGILAVGAAVIGWIQVPGGWSVISDWLDPVFADSVRAVPLEATTTSEWVTGVVSSLVAFLGIGIAWWLFAADPERRLRLAGVGRAPRGVLEEAYRFDDIYDETFVETTRDLGDVLRRDVEPYGPGGLITAAVTSARDAAIGLRAAQTGLVRTYAFAVVAGLAVVGVIFILVLR